MYTAIVSYVSVPNLSTINYLVYGIIIITWDAVHGLLIYVYVYNILIYVVELSYVDGIAQCVCIAYRSSAIWDIYGR